MNESARGLLSAVAARYGGATGARPMFLLEGSGGLFAAGWRLPEYRVTNVWAPHHVLDYRLSGMATITRKCGGVELHRVPAIGSVTFYPGDQPTEWESDSPIEAIQVYIASGALASFAEQHLEGATKPRIRDFFGVSDPWLAAYFRLLAAECELYDNVRGSNPQRPAASLFLDQTEPLLLRHLVRHYSDAARTASRSLDKRIRVNPLRRSVTRRIEEYIESNLDADVSLHMLAELAHLSADHFVRAFRGATGTTPHRFVLDQRLGHAAAMLKADRASIADVAHACGFRSAAHFSVKFHARFGVTPSQYRRSA
jgi:AraC family transcriptional regulator